MLFINSSYEHFRLYVPLFGIAIALTVSSSIMICYGAATDYNALWINGIVLGCLAVVFYVYGFYVLCMIFNPSSGYRKRQQWKKETADLSAGQVYLPRPGPPSVLSYPSAMNVPSPQFLPPSLQFKAEQYPLMNEFSNGVSDSATDDHSTAQGSTVPIYENMARNVSAGPPPPVESASDDGTPWI